MSIYHLKWHYSINSRLSTNIAAEKLPWVLFGVVISGIISQTRWYPQGIQELVSTYVLSKFQFSEGGVIQNWKCQNLTKFQFSGGSGYSWVVKTQSAKICLNFSFGGLGVLDKARIAHSWHFLSNNFAMPCHTLEALASPTTYVETNHPGTHRVIQVKWYTQDSQYIKENRFKRSLITFLTWFNVNINYSFVFVLENK